VNNITDSIEWFFNQYTVWVVLTCLNIFTGVVAIISDGFTGTALCSIIVGITCIPHTLMKYQENKEVKLKGDSE
jgi:hypothetical protein